MVLWIPAAWAGTISFSPSQQGPYDVGQENVTVTVNGEPPQPDEQCCDEEGTPGTWSASITGYSWSGSVESDSGAKTSSSLRTEVSGEHTVKVKLTGEWECKDNEDLNEDLNHETEDFTFTVKSEDGEIVGPDKVNVDQNATFHFHRDGQKVDTDWTGDSASPSSNGNTSSYQTKWSSTGTYTVRANDGTVTHDVEVVANDYVVTVTGPPMGIEGVYYKFEATVDPPGYTGEITWTAVGANPVHDEDTPFDTKWENLGDYTVQAKLDSGQDGSKEIEIVGTPAVEGPVQVRVGHGYDYHIVSDITVTPTWVVENGTLVEDNESSITAKWTDAGKNKVKAQGDGWDAEEEVMAIDLSMEQGTIYIAVGASKDIQADVSPSGSEALGAVNFEVVSQGSEGGTANWSNADGSTITVSGVAPGDVTVQGNLVIDAQTTETFSSKSSVKVVKAQFKEEEVYVAWEEDGTWDAKEHLTEDSEDDEVLLEWSLDDAEGAQNPQGASIDSETGQVTFGEVAPLAEYTVTVEHTGDSDAEGSDEITLKVVHVEFEENSEEEKKHYVVWTDDPGTVDATEFLTEESEKEDLEWEINTEEGEEAQIDQEGEITFSEEGGGVYTITAKHENQEEANDEMILYVMEIVVVDYFLAGGGGYIEDDPIEQEFALVATDAVITGFVTFDPKPDSLDENALDIRIVQNVRTCRLIVAKDSTIFAPDSEAIGALVDTNENYVWDATFDDDNAPDMSISFDSNVQQWRIIVEDSPKWGPPYQDKNNYRRVAICEKFRSYLQVKALSGDWETVQIIQWDVGRGEMIRDDEEGWQLVDTPGTPSLIGGEEFDDETHEFPVFEPWVRDTSQPFWTVIFEEGAESVDCCN